MIPKKLDSLRKKFEPQAYAIFRIAFGVLFLGHGLQKIFGILGGNVAAPFSLMWFAGIIELFGGALITVGLLTNYAAGIAALEMLIAVFIGHIIPNDWTWSPYANGAERALLFMFAFILIKVHGAGIWSLDRNMPK